MSPLRDKTDLPAEKGNTSLRFLDWRVKSQPYTWSPPTDVFETDTHLVIRVELAGMRESEFVIEVDGQNLMITGSRADLEDQRSYQQMEIRFGDFVVNAILPAGVEPCPPQVEYEDGFLTICFPKQNVIASDREG
jgi:HSP20 family molecular chaperone IbpA